MAGKRRRYGAEFKARVALEALRGELTIAQLVAKHGVHRTLINTWKRQAMEGMSEVFSNGAEAAAAAADREAELDRLHAKIGQLVVERDFLRKGEPSKAPSVRARWRAVDERRPEARDDRARAPAAVDRAAVPARLDQPVGVLRPGPR